MATLFRQDTLGMEDLNRAGGVYAVMNELNKKGLLHTDCLDCNRKRQWVRILRVREQES